mgnify:CR=1 FL=1
MSIIYIGDKTPSSMYLGTLNVGSIILGDGTQVWPQVSPSPSPQASPSVTPSVTPSITPSISVSPSVTPSITPSRTPSITPSISRTPSITPSRTPSTSFAGYYYSGTHYLCVGSLCKAPAACIVYSLYSLTVGGYYSDGSGTDAVYISSTTTPQTYGYDATSWMYASSCANACMIV